jgi:hypothetical protein
LIFQLADMEIRSEETIAAKLRDIRQKHAGNVLQLTRVAARAIQEIRRIEATMAAEAAAVTQGAVDGRSFEAICRDFCKEDASADMIDTLKKDAAVANARVFK